MPAHLDPLEEGDLFIWLHFGSPVIDAEGSRRQFDRRGAVAGQDRDLQAAFPKRRDRRSGICPQRLTNKKDRALIAATKSDHGRKSIFLLGQKRFALQLAKGRSAERRLDAVDDGDDAGARPLPSAIKRALQDRLVRQRLGQRMTTSRAPIARLAETARDQFPERSRR